MTLKSDLGICEAPPFQHLFTEATKTQHYEGGF